MLKYSLSVILATWQHTLILGSMPHIVDSLTRLACDANQRSLPISSCQSSVCCQVARSKDRIPTAPYTRLLNRIQKPYLCLSPRPNMLSRGHKAVTIIDTLPDLGLFLIYTFSTPRKFVYSPYATLGDFGQFLHASLITPINYGRRAYYTRTYRDRSTDPSSGYHS